MNFEPFELERLLSDWEQTVEFNFAESGVHPVSLGELLELSDIDIKEFLETPLNYPEVNGEASLREKIAGFYDGAKLENILVTVGASEANYILANTLLKKGDEIAVMQPTYKQFSGAAKNLGVKVNSFSLEAGNNWALNRQELLDAVNLNTKVISVVNPNNPTGKILSKDEMNAVVSIAQKFDAWLLADEVYSGAERHNVDATQSFFGLYEKVIIVNGLSKAYGLPGLRIGWVVAPENIITELWKRHEYTTVSSSMLGNRLANLALRPDVKRALIARTRDLVDSGFETLQTYLNEIPGVFSVVPPMASALSFTSYNLPINSTELVHKLRREKGILLVPGDCFGLDGHLRISSALPREYLQGGLSRLNEVVRELAH
ncbi:MAG: aminotransferase class I/II-fold pyridoxal phosphate-dependent enzyme [Pseudomonadota bacterium]|nr:aminotransferase class I/II-fold pyridoxal phosphate-dependent enzyme [Pseudomonadota bacterium]MED5300043.1 aminotransferase class I/II-fold pyridoxal phosphate-dependent enzyme [Pseudomonadota bacterium]